MTLLRRVLGDTLRGRRLRQRRTLREVSGAARVSLGYLSEVERGQKEASSELLAAICEALDVKLSDLLWEVSETMRRSERAAEVARVPGRVILPAPARRPVPAGVGPGPGPAPSPTGFDGAGFEAAGFDGASLDAASFEAAGFEAAGFDAAGFEESAEAPAAEPVAEPVGALDSAALLPAAPVGLLDPTELDGVDLAELETGDGLGELEILVGLTDLPGRGDGPYAARCLAAA
jgi:transcriptional regulator with XRE-family HTH domain